LALATEVTAVNLDARADRPNALPLSYSPMIDNPTSNAMNTAHSAARLTMVPHMPMVYPCRLSR